MAIACGLACSRPAKRFSEAREHLRAGHFELASQTAGTAASDSPEIAGLARLLRAEIAIRRADLSAAESLLQTPVVVSAGVEGWNSSRASIWRDRLLGTVAVRRREFDKALGLLEPALQRARDHAIRDEELELLLALAVVASRQDRDDEATALWRMTRDLARTYRDPERAALASLAEAVELLDGDPDGALLLLRAAEESLRDRPDSAWKGALAGNISAAETRVGNLPMAMAMGKRALALHEKSRSYRWFAQTSLSMGQSHAALGERVEAIRSYRQGYAHALRLEEDQLKAFAAASLTSALLDAGNREATEIHRAFERHAASGAAGADAKQTGALNAARLARLDGDLVRSRELHERSIAESTVLPIKWRAQASLANLLASVEPKAAPAQYESAIRTIEQARARLFTDRSAVSFLGPVMQPYQEYVELLLKRKDYDRARAVIESSRARALAGLRKPRAVLPGAAELSRRAGESGAVILSYWVAPERSWLEVISSAGSAWHELPGEAEISRRVRAHQEFVVTAMRDPLASADGPAHRLLKAVVPFTPPAGAAVAVIPDGPLWDVNFETLPSPAQAKRFWVEDAVIQVLPALAEMRPAAASREPLSMLVAGDATAADPSYPPLKNAGPEIDRVIQAFGPERTTPLRRETANPAAVRNAGLGRFTHIHFATHGTANPLSPLDSALVLSPAGQSYLLYAHEIANLDLHADLVTMSACRSAGSALARGEGLAGLAWAFLHAGANGVVSGLWDVSDGEITSNMMADLYAGVRAGKHPAVTLREAKLRAIARGGPGRKPYYWGPFQYQSRSLPPSATQKKAVSMKRFAPVRH